MLRERSEGKGTACRSGGAQDALLRATSSSLRTPIILLDALASTCSRFFKSPSRHAYLLSQTLASRWHREGGVPLTCIRSCRCHSRPTQSGAASLAARGSITRDGASSLIRSFTFHSTSERQLGHCRFVVSCSCRGGADEVTAAQSLVSQQKEGVDQGLDMRR